MRRAPMRGVFGSAVVAAAGLVIVAGTTTFHPFSPATTGEAKTAARPVWTETAWPFARDAWGSGKAYTCRAADCGANIDVYVRPKIGLCDCSRGVADDDDLERFSDIDLIDSRYRTFGPGRPISVASRQGRIRAYTLADSSRPTGTALTVAFHDRCDLVVATAVIAQHRAPGSAETVMRLLEGDIVWHWLEKAL